MSATRISPKQAHADIQSGALLVCGYDDDSRFQKYRLDKAISFRALQARENTLPKNSELIFYCA